MGPKVPWDESVANWLELQQSVDETIAALDDKMRVGRNDTAMAECRQTATLPPACLLGNGVELCLNNFCIHSRVMV